MTLLRKIIAAEITGRSVIAEAELQALDLLKQLYIFLSLYAWQHCFFCLWACYSGGSSVSHCCALILCVPVTDDSEEILSHIYHR